MPEETLTQYHEHGHPEPRLEHNLAEARRLIRHPAAAGVDYDDVTQTLEREGVAQFAGAFDELLNALREKSLALAR
jgi:transaldolase